MSVYPFFPQAMGVYKFYRRFTQEEKEFFLNQECVSNTGNLTSKNNEILEAPLLAEIKTFINDSLNNYFEEVYKPSTDVNPYITQSWLSYTRKQEYHHRHHHKNSFLSGIFYVKADIRYDNVVFIKTDTGMLAIEGRHPTDYNIEYYPLKVESGLLLIFPSSTDHYVPISENEDVRISLAFNSFLKGTIGNKESLCEIKF